MKDLQIIQKLLNIIYMIPGQRVMPDRDLADLYGVETKVLNQAVTRNIERFPDDFMFRLSKQEVDDLRSQFVTANELNISSKSRSEPRVFTEQGIVMLSGVLNSKRAIQINIMRTFVKIREMISEYADVIERLDHHEVQIKKLFDVVSQLIEDTSPAVGMTNKIGFKLPN